MLFLKYPGFVSSGPSSFEGKTLIAEWNKDLVKCCRVKDIVELFSNDQLLADSEFKERMVVYSYLYP